MHVVDTDVVPSRTDLTDCYLLPHPSGRVLDEVTRHTPPEGSRCVRVRVCEGGLLRLFCVSGRAWFVVVREAGLLYRFSRFTIFPLLSCLPVRTRRGIF